MDPTKRGYYGGNQNSNHGADAPEVAETNYAYALPPDEAGLEAVQEVPKQDIREYRAPQEAYAPVDEKAQPAATGGRRWSRWIWVAAAVLILVIALGVGIGVGVSVGHGDSKDTTKNTSGSHSTAPAQKTTAQSTTANSITSQPGTSTTKLPSSHTTTSTSSASSSAVTSGTTGIADFSCNTTLKDSTYTIHDTTFTEQCFCDYPNGGAVWNDTSQSGSPTETFSNLGQYTVYSFQDCMDQCVQWNDQINTGSNTKQCVSVSYCANLTQVVGSLLGNCFLKPARGVPYTNGNYTLWASAYIAALS